MVIYSKRIIERISLGIIIFINDLNMRRPLVKGFLKESDSRCKKNQSDGGIDFIKKSDFPDCEDTVINSKTKK